MQAVKGFSIKLMFGVSRLPDNSLPETKTALDESPQQSGSRIIDLSKLTLYIVAVGAFFDALSIFIPWGQMGNIYWYLPLSVPIGWPAVFMEGSTFIWTITLTLKLAVFTALISLLFVMYSKNRLSQVALIVSIISSLISFQVAFAHGEILYLGFTVAAIGCLVNVFGIVLRYLEIELVP